MIYFYVTLVEGTPLDFGAAKSFVHHGEYKQFGSYPVWTYEFDSKLDIVSRVDWDCKEICLAWDEAGILIPFKTIEEFLDYQENIDPETEYLGLCEVQEILYGLG